MKQKLIKGPAYNKIYNLYLFGASPKDHKRFEKHIEEIHNIENEYESIFSDVLGCVEVGYFNNLILKKINNVGYKGPGFYMREPNEFGNGTMSLIFLHKHKNLLPKPILPVEAIAPPKECNSCKNLKLSLFITFVILLVETLYLIT